MTAYNWTVFSNLSMFYPFEQLLLGSCLGPTGKFHQLYFWLRERNFRLLLLNFRLRQQNFQLRFQRN